MKYKRRRYNLRRTKNVKYHIRPSQRVSDRNGLRSRVTKGRNPWRPRPDLALLARRGTPKKRRDESKKAFCQLKCKVLVYHAQSKMMLAFGLWYIPKQCGIQGASIIKY